MRDKNHTDRATRAARLPLQPNGAPHCKDETRYAGPPNVRSGLASRAPQPLPSDPSSCGALCGAGWARVANPPNHSITSSARASSDAVTSRPSALAVFRLSTNSNFVGCTSPYQQGWDKKIGDTLFLRYRRVEGPPLVRALVATPRRRLRRRKGG